MKTRTRWVLAAWLSLAAAAGAPAATVYVGPSGSDVLGCGAQSAPCLTIRFGIGAAAAGDTVRVLAGPAYSECVSTAGKRITVVADAFEVSGDRSATIIDGTDRCGPASGQSGPTVTVGTQSELRGFTVRGGGDSGIRALGGAVITKNVITGNAALQQGGGIQAYTSTAYADTDPLRIEYNDVTDNVAFVQGGGIFVRTAADAVHHHDVSVKGNVIHNNSTTSVSTPQLNAGGGGLFVQAASLQGGHTQTVVTQNTIEGNSATGSVVNGAYVYANQGGGLWAASYALGVDSIQITNNTISGNRVSATGGGVALFTYTGSRTSSIGQGTITFSGNIVEANTANDPNGESSGAGVWAESVGYSVETIQLSNNQVRTNSAKSFGGGVSLWNFATQTGTQTVAADGGNTLSGNLADGGGGLDLLLALLNRTSSHAEIRAVDNDITGNQVSGTFGSGGGVIMSIQSDRSNAPGASLKVQGNRITGNTAEAAGGGALLELIVDGRPAAPTPAAHSVGHALFKNNLVSGNDARSVVAQDATGGGVYVYLEADGDAVCSADLDFNTVLDNVSDVGSGGIELESFTDQEDPVGHTGPIGTAQATVKDSIVSGNVGFGVGGPVPGIPGRFGNGGTGALTVSLGYNDTFSNQGGDYEAWLPSGTGDITGDPQLNALGICRDDPAAHRRSCATAADCNSVGGGPCLLGIPSVCSPTIDAADPVADFSLEPASGGRANMGHLGDTAEAVIRLLDMNGDHVVDGIEILRVALSSGSHRADPRYDDLANVDGDDIVDGDDLSFVALQFGTQCP